MTRQADTVWAEFEANLGDREIALVVGAGVSSSSKLPSWWELVSELLQSVKIDATCLHELALPAPAQIELARRVHASRHDAALWPDVVREIIYRHFVTEITRRGLDFSHEAAKQPNAKLAQFMRNQNPTLAAIVDLCSKRTRDPDKTRRHYAPNKRVGAVLTYNLDALLQIFDRAEHGRRVLRTIERASASRRMNKINLYHLHGYLLPTPSDPAKEAADQLVLSESEYHDRTDDAHNFANASMLWALREFVCIFVGCSMTDELMRRSLHRSLRERTAALVAEGERPETVATKSRRHYAVALESQTPGANELKELDLAALGVKPLWVRDFKTDLPDRLNRLATRLSL